MHSHKHTHMGEPGLVGLRLGFVCVFLTRTSLYLGEFLGVFCCVFSLGCGEFDCQYRCN